MTKPKAMPGSTDGAATQTRTICVFCGSSSGSDPAYAEMARRLGAEVAEAGHRMVYGGGDVGLMGIVADAAMAEGAEVLGVMTEQLVEAEVAHSGLSLLDVQPTMHARKARMAELADGVVVLPGGFGTWEEAFEVLTWNQLGLIAAPVIFLDVDGFFESLFALIDHAAGAGFINPDNAALAVRVDDARTAVKLAAEPAPPYVAKWVG